ncbi:hypothetical protein AMATHDRAFT_10904 [Amanita thiersii Skay4041]|uniref:Uncharacterized protein n=1 Tax=Amanita thiersii Skay4041 TaxID=703135 RepID=A0A2A9NAX5_9AGAR|nr:hypothetical protein AMATHDRAFT_10904 [Amanita thiersii Skay4041]
MPKASLVISPHIGYRPLSMDNSNKDNGIISHMRLAAFDESQNIAQPVPSHPPPAFLATDFVNSDIHLTGTLISLPALMDKPQSSDFPSSTDPTFVLQNIFMTNANNLMQTKGYIPLVQAKDMGKALATHIRACTGSGFDHPRAERTIHADLLARIVAYAAAELNTEVADYTVASHGSSIPLIIYCEVQEDWDFSGNSDNYLLTDTINTIQDDLDEAFTNRQHKNIMSISTPISDFSIQDKHTILDSIANETTLPEKWAFPIPPSNTFSPVIGQKRPLDTDQEMDDITHVEHLNAIKYQIPLPQSTIEANIEAWTTTSNNCLDICRSKFPGINPTVLTSTVMEYADKIGKREYFTNKIRQLARSKDLKALQDFENERLHYLLQEVTPLFSETSNKEQIQDLNMEDVTPPLSKIELIRKSTAIWKDTANTMWKENILTCSQPTLDQATHLLLLEDSTHKYAQLTDDQIYDMEINRRDMIITRITELNSNMAKIISDICKKSMPTANQGKINLITQQGWETVKRAILRNPSKYIPNNIPNEHQMKILDSIVDDLKLKDDHEWAHKIIKDVKNKGLQSKALEHHIQAITHKLNSWLPPSPSPALQNLNPDLNDQDMPLADPTPWTETDEYKHNLSFPLTTTISIRPNNYKHSISPSGGLATVSSLIFE